MTDINRIRRPGRGRQPRLVQDYRMGGLYVEGVATGHPPRRVEW